MKALVLSLAVLGFAAVAGVAQAEGGCAGSFHEKTAESPPPPPAPST